MWLERSKLRTIPASVGVADVGNKPNDDGDAGGDVDADALVPKPPGGRPPPLKAEAALPLPPFHLRAVSLSIRDQSPLQI